MKVFLSHSSKNKDFVDSVAKELGRQFCIYDKLSFQSGIEFKESINTGLDDSNIFVLFASKEAMESIWVQFEIEEAVNRSIQKRIKRILVLILDENLQVSSLPEWLQRSRAIYVGSPKHAARDIRNHFYDLLTTQSAMPFIGRTSEISEAETALFTPTADQPMRFLFFVGLPNIGRRTLAKRVAQTVYGMKSITEILIEPSDNLKDLVFKLATEIEAYTDSRSLASLQASIDALSSDAAVKRGIDCLIDICESGSLPSFIDGGGFIEDSGSISSHFTHLIQQMAENQNIHVFFVSSRKPVSTDQLRASFIRVKALSTTEIGKLLQALALKVELKLLPQQISKAAELICGYPPSCYLAIQLMKEYGVTAILSNSIELVDFRVSTLLNYISRHTLMDSEKMILRLLANYSPLPLSVIASFCNLDTTAVSRNIFRLVDLSMIYPDIEGNYLVSEPLADAIFKTYPFFSPTECRKLVQMMNNWLDEFGNQNISLSLSRNIYRIASQAKDSTLANRVVHMEADAFRIAEYAYQQQDYKLSVTMFRKVIALRPDNERAIAYLVRSLAHLEEWDECDSLCTQLERVGGSLRTIAFLRGFVLRKRNRITDAIEQFEMARRAGRSDVALFRELAWCYYISENYKQAQSLLAEAFEKQPDNSFLIDMSIQISIALDDFAAAKEQLERLSIFEKGLFYWHRMATFLSAQDRFRDAVDAGMKAINGDKPRFEALVHLAYCELRLGHINEARGHLASLDKHYHNLRKRITNALYCHIELADGHADEVLKRITLEMSKSDRYCATLRCLAIQKLLTTHKITDETLRKKLEVELSGSTSSLSEPRFFDLPRC